MISGVLKKASVFLPEGARVVIPAAGRSADHEDKEFLKRLPEE